MDIQIHLYNSGPEIEILDGPHVVGSIDQNGVEIGGIRLPLPVDWTAFTNMLSSLEGTIQDADTSYQLQRSQEERDDLYHWYHR